MKLIVCIFLVLVILEQYHCDPCLDWLFPPRHRDRGGDRRLRFSPGFSANPVIQGNRGHRGYEHSWHTHHQYSSYGTNSLGYRQRQHTTWNHSPYYQHYNTPYGWRQTSFRPRPHYRIQYPSPNGNHQWQSPPYRSPDVYQNEENLSQEKKYIVTPDGIREAPAQNKPSENSQF